MPRPVASSRSWSKTRQARAAVGRRSCLAQSLDWWRDRAQQLLGRDNRGVGLWTSAVKEWPHQGEQARLQGLLHRLDHQAIRADSATYARLLHACCKLKLLSEGRRVHAHIVRSGLERDIFLANHLVSMYGKCGSVDDARRMFDQMDQRNVVSWTAMIAVYAHHRQRKEALQLFRRMQMEGVIPNKITFITVLNACASSAALPEGKMIHACIIESGFESDVVVGNALVSMYGKCGSVEDAWRMFNKMHLLNVVSWNTMIATYAQHGHGKEALQLFRRMQLEGLKPNKITVLNACSSVSTLVEGKMVHACVVESRLESDVVIGTAIVSVYGKCGSVGDARRMFDKMFQRDIVSWTAMIAAYAQHGCNKEAIQLFQQMQLEGMKPNQITFITVLQTCTSPAALAEGKMIHARVVESGFESDVVVGSALVSMYGKCGSVEDAWRIFDNMYERDVVAWNAMIGVCAHHGHGMDALQLFRRMYLEGVKPDKITFVSVLSACASPADLAEGKNIHACIVGSGLESDISVGNALVNMYGKCGSVMDARTIFDKMHQRDVISWTAMIAAYDQLRHGKEALQLFRQMQQQGVKPNEITFISLLSACASLADLAEGRMIHAHVIESGFESDDVVGSALVNMYGKCGSVDDARNMFDKMHQRDVVSWTAMIAAYSQHQNGKEALQLFHQMQLEGVKPTEITFITVLHACASLAALAEGKMIHAHVVESGFESDVALGNALVTMYGKCGSLEDARRMFEKMHQRTVVSWTAMIAAYAQLGCGKEAIHLFQRMQHEGVRPNEITFASVLSACASLSALAEGKMIHACVVESGFMPDDIVGSALVNMYGKCGSVDDARRMFDKMHQRSVTSWNAMLAVYAQHGHGKEALQLFQRMQQDGVKPNEISFVSILFACSHAGLVEEGCHHFYCMCGDHGIRPMASHYGCMIDLFGRAGQLDEAEDFINKIPFQPGVVEWMTLLGACRNYGDVERGKRAAEHVLKLDPQCAAAYVVLSNIYAAAGRWIDAEKVRKMMVDRGLKKQPGRSSIEIKNRVHEFLVGDRSHPQTEEIYAELERLSREMKEAGFVPNTKLVLLDVEEEEKEQLLCCHSEKLAIAFGLISTPHGTLLRITKNLRVCSNCHTATKFISKIAGRELVVRDANRFHHFKDGMCSCGDYW